MCPWGTTGRAERTFGNERPGRRERGTNHHATATKTGHWMWHLAPALRGRHSSGSRCRSGRRRTNASGATRRARVPATKVVRSGTQGLASHAGSPARRVNSPRETPALQEPTAKRTSLGSDARHGDGAHAPEPVGAPMTPSPWGQAFKGRSPREHRAPVEWQHTASATDSSADENPEAEQTGATRRAHILCSQRTDARQGANASNGERVPTAVARARSRVTLQAQHRHRVRPGTAERQESGRRVRLTRHSC